MTRPDSKPSPWRTLWLIPVSVFAVLTIVATGGGGGGDDGGGSIDDVDPGPVTILPTYNFLLTNLSSGELLTASLGSGLSVSIDIDGILHNSFDLSVSASNEVTFLSYVARRTSGFDLIVTSGGIDPLDGTIAVTLTEDLTFDVVGEPPASGAFTVVTPGETVSLTVVTGGVELSLNGGAAVAYTWDEFGNLLDDETQETWLRRASLAGGAFEFLYGYFFDIADILDELELVTLTNPLVETCDMFTGSPPAGVLAQGDISVTWTGSGELSDGDDFIWDFTQCWFGESDELLDGTITLENYTETVDFNTNTLFEIGFGNLSGQDPGGVIFDLTVSETVENNGVFTIAADDVITITGGFVMIIQDPL